MNDVTPARDEEGRVAVLGRARHPGRLARHLVRVLVLEEDHLAALAVPDDLVLLVVLDEQAVARARCCRSRSGPVLAWSPVHDAGSRAVVGPPGPDVVDDRVVAVVDERGRRRAGLGSADPEEHVVDGDRVARRG